MDAHEPVTCPLCGAVVRDKRTPDAGDIHALERHFTEDCPKPMAKGAIAS